MKGENTVTCRFPDPAVGTTTFQYKKGKLLLVAEYKPDNKAYVQEYIKTK
jgi:hypothetical protein